MRKPGIIFVGSFSHLAKTAHAGGMTKMCQLILDSDISKKVQWHLIDSTAPHNKIRSFRQRAIPAIRRLTTFIWFLLTKRVDKVFIFTSQGWGFYEKGLMVLIAKAFRKKTILALRSGFLMKDIDSSEVFKKRAAHILKNSDIIIVQGNYWKEFLTDQFNISEQKIVIIPNGIERKHYMPTVKKDKVLRLLFMGFIEKNKGIYDVLEALSLLKTGRWELDIAGDGIALRNVRMLTIKFGFP